MLVFSRVCLHSYAALQLAMVSLLVGCVDQRPPSHASAEPTVLQGSSSTFAAQAYFRWFNQLAVRENVNTELMVVGSGESIRHLLSGRVAFAEQTVRPRPRSCKRRPGGCWPSPSLRGPSRWPTTPRGASFGCRGLS